MAVARQVLRRGGAVAMMIDQVPATVRHAVGIEFLGRAALADRAPAALAASTGAPLVVVAARASGNGEHVVHVLAVIRPPPRPQRVGGAWDAWIAGATVASAGALDAFVRAHPSQWLWMHRRWRAAGVDRRGHEATLGGHGSTPARGSPRPCRT
jgi:KDO2-lipid IV(A) lauroyltransferase